MCWITMRQCARRILNEVANQATSAFSLRIEAKRTKRRQQKMKRKMKMADRILFLILVVLAVPILAIIIIASPVLGVSVPIAGVAFAFRRRLGQLKVGLILLLLGIALVVAALTSSEQWERAEENEYSAWVADRRRNPCGPREALLLVSFLFLAVGGGMLMTASKISSKETGTGQKGCMR